MLAVLEDGASHLVETVENAHIDGTTVVERMSKLIDVFSAHYARPDYLASLQVLLNMDHDPRTSSEVRKTMVEVAERANAHVRRLLREALGPAANKPDLSTAIFVVIRGFAFSQQLLDSMAYDTLAPKRRSRRAASAPVGRDACSVRRNGGASGALTGRSRSVREIRGSIMTQRFAGRSAIVTGASRGIGRAVAIQLASEGADVAIVARSVEPGTKISGSLNETAERVRGLGSKCLVIGSDLSDSMWKEK